MVAKSFTRKQVLTNNFHESFLVENFLWLQNQFLENRFWLKIFIKNFCWNIFIVAKTFPRKQVWTKNFHQKFFGSISFMVAKSFPRIQVLIKNLRQKFYCWKFFMVAKSLPRKQVLIKIFVNNFFADNSLLLQSHFLGKRF